MIPAVPQPRLCPVCQGLVDGTNFTMRWERKAFPFFFLKKNVVYNYAVVHFDEEYNPHEEHIPRKTCELTKTQWDEL